MTSLASAPLCSHSRCLCARLYVEESDFLLHLPPPSSPLTPERHTRKKRLTENLTRKSICPREPSDGQRRYCIRRQRFSFGFSPHGSSLYIFKVIFCINSDFHLISFFLSTRGSGPQIGTPAIQIWSPEMLLIKYTDKNKFSAKKKKLYLY